MAIYHITAPDGGTYEVNAPDNASQGDVLAYAKQNFQKPANHELKSDLGHQAAAGLIAFGQGGMPVFDEAGAGAGALLEKAGLGNMTGGNAAPDNASLGDIYDKRLGNIRGVENSFSEQHPILDPALRVAGGVATVAALPGASATMASRPILAGAGYGAAQGFAGGTGGIEQRGVNAGVGGALGAGSALVANKVVNPLASKIFSRSDELTSPLKGAETDTILKNLEMGDVTPQQYAAALRNSTTDDFAGELGGEPLRMLTQNQAKISSPAMQTARTTMRDRVSQAPDRASAIIQNAFGSDEDTGTLLSALDIAKGAEKTLYGAADGTIPKSAISDVVNTPAGQKALQATAINLANKQVDPIAAGFVKGEDGLYSLADDVPVNTAHEISKSLGDLVDRNPITGRTETAAAGNIEGLRKQIVDALRSNSLEFNAAQDNAAQVRQADDALSLGRKLAKMATGETADTAESTLLRNDTITPFSQAGFKQGLADTVSNTPLGSGNPIANIAKQRTIDRTSELMGTNVAAKLRSDILAEKMRMELANKALHGSNTPDLLGQAMPEIPTSTQGVIGKVIGAVGDKMQAAGNKRLSQSLYATTPQEKAALAAAILRSSGNTPQIPANQNALAQFLRRSTPLLATQSSIAYSGAGR